jgi:predicted transcriptional regulator
MATDRTKLTIELDRALYERLKVVAARKRTSMREYCVQAVERRLAEEPAEYLTSEADPVLAELWDNEDDAIYDNL